MRAHLEYGMQAWSPNIVADVNHLELGYTAGKRPFFHAPYEARLQWQRIRVDLMVAFKIFMVLLHVDPDMLLSLPPSSGTIGQKCEWVDKYWNNIPVSVVTAPLFECG